MRALVMAIVILLLGCGRNSNPVRMAVYEAPRERVDAATIAVLRELGYPVSGTVVEERFTDIRVGPLFYNASKQRITATVETAPEGSYMVRLFIGVVASRFDERYLDIRPAVVRLEHGSWKFQSVPRGMRRGGGHVDPFQYDGWLASIVDPIFEGVYSRLEKK